MIRVNKRHKITLSIIGSLLWSAICAFLFGPLITGFTDWSLVQPILSEHAPLKVTLEPLQWPVFHDGQYWIKVNIRNNGLRTIKGLNADYLLACQMNRTAKAELHTQTLLKGDSDYFEFAANVDRGCSSDTQPYLIQMFKDKAGRCYSNLSGELISQVCLYCDLNVTLFSRFDIIKSINKSYPFNLGGVTSKVSGPEDCLNLSQAPQDETLTMMQSVYVIVRDLCTECIQGIIKDRAWCKNHCSGVYK